jgi:hypothetical protein
LTLCAQPYKASTIMSQCRKLNFVDEKKIILVTIIWCWWPRKNQVLGNLGAHF